MSNILPPSLPRTPSRRTVASENEQTEPTPPTTDSIPSKKSAFTTDEEGDRVAPPHPFLAYARRVRSFSSPLKINKTRYLLTFVDETTAHEWWKLMQEEYPDSQRESPQLFSFKSDRIPARAWENPRFAHLKNKWSYRQLEPNTPGEAMPNPDPKQSKRRSLGRMLSTPSLRTIGESNNFAPARHVRNDSIIEDPFTGSHSEMRNSIDLAELNRTLDRMQMMMNQTNLRMEALAEKQQMYAESLERLQSAAEANAQQISALTTQHQAGAISTKNMRSSIELNASHVKTVLERQMHEVDATERMEKQVKASMDRLDDMTKAQQSSNEEARATKYSVEKLAEQVQSILQHQRITDEKLEALASAMEHLSATTKLATSRSQSAGNPSAGSVGKVQTVLESHTANLTSLMNGQKSTHKTVQKTQTSIDALSADHAAFIERLDKLQTSTDQNAAQWKQQNERLQTSIDQNALLSKQRTEKQTAKIEQKVNLAMDTKVSKLEVNNEKRMNDLTKLCQNILEKVEETGKKTGCDHDVIPPPRKMNRRLIGYVYSRLGE